MTASTDLVRNGIYQQPFTSSTIPAGSAVALTNNTTANVTSISLPAGTYDISAQVEFVLAAATTTLLQSGPSLTTATLPTQAGGSGLGTDALVTIPLAATLGSFTNSNGCIEIQLVITQTTTVFLTAQASFSAGAVSVYGTLRARQSA